MPGIQKVPNERELPGYRPFYTIVGAVIRRWRRIRRLSRRGLAQLSGYTPTFIQYVEEGRRGMTLESAVAITTALGIALSSFTPELRVRLAMKKPVRRKKAKIPYRSAVVRDRAASVKQKSLAA